MSASPTLTTPAANPKRPLDDESSPSGPTDQPDAKRPALNKPLKDEVSEQAESDAPPALPSEDDGSTTNEAVKEENEAATLQNGSLATQEEATTMEGGNVTPSAATLTDIQPIQSTSSQYDRATSQGPMQHGHQDETGWLHMRAVISSAEAATVIGKGGENVSLVRRHSGAKCTVSDYSRGAVERVLTVSGPVDCVAKVLYCS